MILGCRRVLGPFTRKTRLRILLEIPFSNPYLYNIPDTYIRFLLPGVLLIDGVPSMTPSRQAQECSHENLVYQPSPHASQAGYRSYDPRQLLVAAGKNSKDVPSTPSTFPAPLVLPNDDLALGPRYPPQSFRSWLRGKDRNEITSDRRVIYIAAPPKVDNDIVFVRRWILPRLSNSRGGVGKTRKGSIETPISTPKTNDVVEYLAAFYHGMTVKQLPFDLTYASWDDEEQTSKTKSTSSPFIALNTPYESVRIRTRTCPDDMFPTQLSLNDLLDVAISVLPKDAYALLMLVDHDLYEDEDDDFCCGRAYGGSRVAVVSKARYNPVLDGVQGVERQHAWPASHCENYVKESCATVSWPSKKAKTDVAPSTTVENSDSESNALEIAVRAHRTIPPDKLSTPEHLASLWLSRTTRTASHELGHCFGIDHCVYYACIMQGTASMAEDVRQPPYLCPVELAKIQRAIGLTDKDVMERYKALQNFCGRPGSGFAGFGCWIRGRIGE